MLFMSLVEFCHPDVRSLALRRLNQVRTCALFVCVAWAQIVQASPTTTDLWRDMGLSASLLGGGFAHVSDSSAADHNPAGIALQKTYTVAGEFGWTGQKSRVVEAGACDSTTSELGACFKFRQTQKVTGAVDRRYTLGLAEAFGNGFILGLAGDYVQFAQERVLPAVKVAEKTGQRLRAGLTYTLAEGVLVGVSSDGLYDSTNTPKTHGAGASLQVGQYFLFNGDLHFDADALREMLIGATVFPRDFLDFAVSYGFEPKSTRHRIAGGVVVKSQQARLVYSVVRSSEQSSQLFHTFGIAMFMAGESGSR
ncbi:MAG: hypothetical protein RI953_1032 [Pseudomonadota bacterium]|jgi:hypothetical protein